MACAFAIAFFGSRLSQCCTNVKSANYAVSLLRCCRQRQPRSLFLILILPLQTRDFKRRTHHVGLRTCCGVADSIAESTCGGESSTSNRTTSSGIPNSNSKCTFRLSCRRLHYRSTSDACSPGTDSFDPCKPDTGAAGPNTHIVNNATFAV